MRINTAALPPAYRRAYLGGWHAAEHGNTEHPDWVFQQALQAWWDAGVFDGQRDNAEPSGPEGHR